MARVLSLARTARGAAPPILFVGLMMVGGIASVRPV